MLEVGVGGEVCMENVDSEDDDWASAESGRRDGRVSHLKLHTTANHGRVLTGCCEENDVGEREHVGRVITVDSGCGSQERNLFCSVVTI